MRRQFFAAEFFKRRIGVAEFFAAKIGRFIEFFACDLIFKPHEIAKLAQEPAVDFGHVEDFVHRDACFKRGVHRKKAFVRHFADLGEELLFAHRRELGMIERGKRNFRAAHRFHDRLLERSADRHDFARRFHARTERSARIQKFIEGPFGQLDHNVVDRRLEAGERFARYVVLYLVERIAEGDLRRHFGNGIARRFARKRGRARNARIDFDYGIFKAVGMQRELAVAAALDTELGDNVERSRAQHLVFFIRKRDGGRDDDRIARVNADGVEVFHRTDGEHVARAVAQNFKFDFLPTADVFFDQHLRNRRKHQSVMGNQAQLLFVVRNAAARAAQRISGTDDHGITQLFGDRHAFVHRISDIGRNDRLVYLFHRCFEKLAVFRAVDRAQRRADEPHAPLFQKARLRKLIAHGQPRLSA